MKTCAMSRQDKHLRTLLKASCRQESKKKTAKTLNGWSETLRLAAVPPQWSIDWPAEWTFISSDWLADWTGLGNGWWKAEQGDTGLKDNTSGLQQYFEVLDDSSNIFRSLSVLSNVNAVLILLSVSYKALLCELSLCSALNPGAITELMQFWSGCPALDTQPLNSLCCR